ncbi:MULTISPECIES: hypothetical protein [Xenorhabdus]|uniref:hypothetical protein n=1 Tax=Xenorhabdus TaxID=626 RepID=UPI001E298FE5|nr:hypothetical protein [Xenorhabdus sp. PB30.3]MCC8378165.1 hypothetical protein [Xenorhabdus sp. PB30.3]
MIFDEIKDRFASAGIGTDAFRELYRETFDLMNEDKDNAVIYFLVGVAARSYVLRYDDQEVDPDFAEQSKILMEGFVEKIALSLKQSFEKRIKIASEVASDYHWKTSSF